MTKMIDKAIEALRQLPASEQDAMAREVLARIEEESEWDTLIATPSSQEWLERAARMALEQHNKGETQPIDPASKLP